MSEEKGQTALSWHKSIEKKKHSIKTRYADKHLWTHNASKHEADELRQQKATGATDVTVVS